MSPIQIRSKLDLLNTWAIDRTRFSPDASRPPACLRCGRPLDPVLGHNALSRYADVYILSLIHIFYGLWQKIWACGMYASCPTPAASPYPVNAVSTGCG